jgi:hypothetical protein
MYHPNGLIVGKLPARDMFYLFATTGASFWFRGNPFTIALSTVAEDVMSIGFFKSLLPFVKFLGCKLSRNFHHCPLMLDFTHKIN